MSWFGQSWGLTWEVLGSTSSFAYVCMYVVDLGKYRVDLAAHLIDLGNLVVDSARGWANLGNLVVLAPSARVGEEVELARRR